MNVVRVVGFAAVMTLSFSLVNAQDATARPEKQKTKSNIKNDRSPADAWSAAPAPQPEDGKQKTKSNIKNDRMSPDAQPAESAGSGKTKSNVKNNMAPDDGRVKSHSNSSNNRSGQTN